MKNLLLIACLALAACDGMKGPSLSGDPARMSGDTLCYRAAYAKDDAAINNEIQARHLDCKAMLEEHPPLESRF